MNGLRSTKKLRAVQKRKASQMLLRNLCKIYATVEIHLKGLRLFAVCHHSAARATISFGRWRLL